ncbi:hypothetical protein C6T52_14215 [Burkholderia multivorans]|nr:hypothetical protein C6T52_14215 [Burkholderia multivorans]
MSLTSRGSCIDIVGGVSVLSRYGTLFPTKHRGSKPFLCSGDGLLCRFGFPFGPIQFCQTHLDV